jgi:hypothetical protein
MTNENIKVSLPSQITKVETLADNGFKVVLVTNELPPEQAAFLFSLKGTWGWALFAQNRLQEEDVPAEAEKCQTVKKTPWQASRGQSMCIGISARVSQYRSMYF